MSRYTSMVHQALSPAICKYAKTLLHRPARLIGCLLIGLIFIVFELNSSRPTTYNTFIPLQYTNLCLNLDKNLTCEYPTEVDLRIIVMSYNRPESLSKCLQSLKPLQLDGDTAEINIWLDRQHGSGHVHLGTLQVALAFTWSQGAVRVHTHNGHVGIMGNWIETWRPKENTTEMALFLEDDTDVSPYAYRWLKAAHKKYSGAGEVGGFSMFDKGIPNLNEFPTFDWAFFMSRMGTNAYSPIAKHWRGFQDWYHVKRNDPTFHPYVENDVLITGWYKTFEKSHTEHNMWEMWPIYYHDQHHLFTVFPNVNAYVTAHDPTSKAKGRFFAFHREESGLHYHGGAVESSLIEEWDSLFVDFPDSPVKYFYNGKPLGWDSDSESCCSVIVLSGWLLFIEILLIG